MNRFTSHRRWVACLFLALIAATAWSQNKTRLDVVEPTFSPEIILMQPTAEFDHFEVKVSGPDNLDFSLRFAGDETLELSNIAPDGQLLPDGLYTFEIIAAPIIDSQTRALMREVRQAGDRGMAEALGAELPQGKVQSGTFRIAGGTIVLPDEEEVLQATANKGAEAGEAYQPDDVDAGNNAQVFVTDLVVQGSTCTGFDCVNGENFGFDTLRLKENNLRLHFNDTSNSGSFPTNDWRIVANDTSNGGANYLAIEDSDAGTYPFRVLAGAGSNALYVDAQGDVGLNTSNPVVELHIADGDSPTLRLEQNASSGFTPQTWDLAGNETNFFVRDVTNGSKLPLRIRPGAPDNSIYIDTDGDVGMGTNAPSSSLHIRTTDGTGKLVIQEASSSAAVRNMFEILNQSGPVEMRLNAGAAVGDTSSAWAIRIDNGGNTIFFDELSDPSEEMDLDASGNLTIDGNMVIGNTLLDANDTIVNVGENLDVNGNVTVSGTVTSTGTMFAPLFDSSSDRNLKEEFQVVNPVEVLEKVASLPISTWEFIFEEGDVRHMGPMAQDFHAAFGLGQHDTRINLTDTNGVTMAAIQGLNLKLEEKDAKIAEMQERLQKLEAIVTALQNQ